MICKSLSCTGMMYLIPTRCNETRRSFSPAEGKDGLPANMHMLRLCGLLLLPLLAHGLDAQAQIQRRPALISKSATTLSRVSVPTSMVANVTTAAFPALQQLPSSQPISRLVTRIAAPVVLAIFAIFMYRSSILRGAAGAYHACELRPPLAPKSRTCATAQN